MRLNLKLSHKGIVLVSVPLLFELIFVSLLFVMLQKSEELSALESKSRGIIGAASNVSKALYDGGIELLSYYFSRETVHIERYDKFIKPLPEYFETLWRLTSGNTRQRQHVETIQKLSNKVLFVYTQYGRPANVGGGMVGAFIGINNFRHKWEDSYSVLLEEVHNLTQEEQAELTKITAAVEQAKSAVRIILYAGIAFNVFLTLALAIFFAKGITNRLAVLSDNALKLQRRQKLNPVLVGTDEIAALDKTFHEVADALYRAEQQKQEFISMISHDLRSPLSSLQMTLALVVKGSYGTLTDIGRTRVSKAERSIERLISLISELLDIEKIEAGMLELDRDTMDLKAAIGIAIETVGQLADDHSIEIKDEAPEMEIYADRRRIEQVMVNLLSNAIKYSPKETTVVLDAVKEANYVELRVIDQGKGVPAEDRDQIFERFKQVKRVEETKEKSTGLGLAICKAVVEAHGGTIGVRPNEEKGSTFWFRLPLTAPSPNR